jgi:DNA primase catalytic subunit
MEQMSPKKGTATWKKALPMRKAVKRVEAWGKILAILEEVKIDPKKLKEMEKVLSQITSEIQISIDTEEFSDLFPLYDQRTLAIKLQRTLEELRKKKVQSFCKGG